MSRQSTLFNPQPNQLKPLFRLLELRPAHGHVDLVPFCFWSWLSSYSYTFTCSFRWCLLWFQWWHSTTLASLASFCTWKSWLVLSKGLHCWKVASLLESCFIFEVYYRVIYDHWYFILKLWVSFQLIITKMTTWTRPRIIRPIFMSPPPLFNRSIGCLIAFGEFFWRERNKKFISILCNTLQVWRCWNLSGVLLLNTKC